MTLRNAHSNTPHWLKQIKSHTLDSTAVELQLAKPDAETLKIRNQLKNYGFAIIGDPRTSNVFLVSNAQGFRMALRTYLNTYLSINSRDRTNNIRKALMDDKVKGQIVDRGMGLYSGSYNSPTQFTFGVKSERDKISVTTLSKTPVSTMKKILEATDFC